MTEEELENLRMTWVTALMCTTVFIEAHDEMKETSVYNGKLKSSAKQFEIQLFRKCDKIVHELWKADEIAASDLTQAIREIGKHIATLRPSQVMDLAENLSNDK